MEYIGKETAINIIKKLPSAEINGVEMCSKKRIIKILDFLPTKEITTKMRRDFYSQIYCQSCEHIIPMDAIKVKLIERCPYCGLKIDEFKF